MKCSYVKNTDLFSAKKISVWNKILYWLSTSSFILCCLHNASTFHNHCFKLKFLNHVCNFIYKHCYDFKHYQLVFKNSAWKQFFLIKFSKRVFKYTPENMNDSWYLKPVQKWSSELLSNTELINQTQDKTVGCKTNKKMWTFCSC